MKWLRAQPESLKKARDLALVQVGFFGAFRRSELVAIQVEDITRDQEGLIIRLSRSKTDQQGEGLERVVPMGTGWICAVRGLREWLDQSGTNADPLFRPINRWGELQDRGLRPAAINDLLKSLGEACGFEFASGLSSHSFRRGLSTSAARAYLDFELIKKQGGWKNDATVRVYRRGSALHGQRSHLFDVGVGQTDKILDISRTYVFYASRLSCAVVRSWRSRVAVEA